MLFLLIYFIHVYKGIWENLSWSMYLVKEDMTSLSYDRCLKLLMEIHPTCLKANMPMHMMLITAIFANSS